MPDQEERRLKVDLDAIKVAVQKREKRFLRPLLEELQPYDLGQIFFRLPRVYRPHFIRMLDPGDIALLLEELKTEEQQEILTTLGPEKNFPCTKPDVFRRSGRPDGGTGRGQCQYSVEIHGTG